VYDESAAEYNMFIIYCVYVCLHTWPWMTLGKLLQNQIVQNFTTTSKQLLVEIYTCIYNITPVTFFNYY